MPLSQDDIDRLSGLGYRGFIIVEDNEKRLRNLKGECFFLSENGCKVYQNRPEGCRLYPLILNLDDTVGVDSDCPQAEDFTYTNEDISKLRALVNRIEKENLENN